MGDAERRKLYDAHLGEVVTCVSLDPAWRDRLSFAPNHQRFAIDPGSLFREGVRWALQKHRLRFAVFKDSDPEAGECFCVESVEFPDVTMRAVVLDEVEGLADVSAAPQGEGAEFSGGVTEVEATRIASRFLESNNHVVVPTDYRGTTGPGKPPLLCCAVAWYEDHWAVLFTPSDPEGVGPTDVPLTIVHVDGATGEAKFFVK